jgi:hypothetical protein
VDPDYTCRQCGRSGNPYGRGRCAHRVLAERVRDLLAGPGDVISPQLQPLAEALAQSGTPFKMIQWLKQSPTAKMLAPARRRGAVDEPLAAGRAPARPQAALHPADHGPDRRAGRTVRGPGTAPVLARPPPSRQAGRDLRRRILVALDLLAWIDQQNLTLGELRQDDIDRWLEAGRSQTRNLVRYFLKWTAGRGLTRKLTVPLIPRQEPADLLGDDERWQLLSSA